MRPENIETPVSKPPHRRPVSLIWGDFEKGSVIAGTFRRQSSHRL
jgi:hypothetical protein